MQSQKAGGSDCPCLVALLVKMGFILFEWVVQRGHCLALLLFRHADTVGWPVAISVGGKIEQEKSSLLAVLKAWKLFKLFLLFHRIE